MQTLQQKFLPQRILIIRLSSIGDVTRTLPALTSLRRQFPRAHIAWAVEDKSAGLLEGHPHLDEAIVFERNTIRRQMRNPFALHRGIARLGSFATRVAGGDFDLVLDFHGIFKSGAIAGLTHAPVRAGFARGFVKEFSYLFTNTKVRPADAFLPRVERNLALIRPFVSEENLSAKTVLGLTSAHRDKAGAFIREKFGEVRPLVAMHPGTSRLLKQWDPERFAQVCDMLAETFHAKAVLTWGPGERKLVEAIRAHSRAKPEIAFESSGLLELAALLERCDLMITVDCGPMHIGSLVGAPVVALFGPTDVRINAPYWHPHKTVTAPLDCCPCEENCTQAKCMEAISPKEVFEAAGELLKMRQKS